MGNILVSGSTAYDYIMDYKDKFKNHIKPENIHKLSVSFLIDDLKKERGGTGLNISYNLALLGSKSILLSGIGSDYEFNDYLFDNVNLEYIYRSENLLSSSGYITNDSDGSQITAFYPGAMMESDKVSITSINEEIKYAIISPNKKETMFKHMGELKILGVKTFFDPGQAIFSMNKQDLLNSLELADYLIVNDYEFDLFKDISGLTKNEIINSFEKVIITMGEKGSVIIDKDGENYIQVVENGQTTDPTGAGDAYRAGLLRGLVLGYDWITSANIGSLIASYSVGFYGAQNHFIEKNDFEKWFMDEFGTEICL